MVPTTLRTAPAVETPNAVMRTYASPSLNDAPVAVWRTDMAAETTGPLHTVDQTQVLVVVSGRARIQLGEEQMDLEPGDGVVLPAGCHRQVQALDGPVTTLSSSLPDASAQVADRDPVALAWTR